MRNITVFLQMGFSSMSTNESYYEGYEIPLENCQRCGDGPLVGQNDFENKDDFTATLRSFDYPDLCDWCGHSVNQNIDK
ncbi:hypothetical protein CCP4SC76_7640018 [Gammaproteobacteria bacterium]